jgi:alkylhydroperoxidase family enzyme
VTEQRLARPPGRVRADVRLRRTRYGATVGSSETGELMASVLVDHPDVLGHLDDLHEAVWSVGDPVLLELCRLRIARLLGCEAEEEVRTPAAIAAGLDEATIAELAAWPSSARFGPRERTCLAVCEQLVIDVAGMSDDIALAAAEQLGAVAFRDFVTALLVLEQRQRLRLAWERLYGSETRA